MNDLIDRQLAIDDVVDELDRIDHVPQWVFNRLAKRLNNVPPVDTQIIQCKNCRWWTNKSTTLQGKCKLHGLNPMPEWYCASGEVKE